MKYALLLVSIACFLIFLCPVCKQNDKTVIHVTPDSMFELPIGKTALLTSQDLRIKFDSVINDSRCPTGVVCIWVGEAKSRILITQNGRKEELILTQTGDSEGRANIGQFSVKFSLLPYPRGSETISPELYRFKMILLKE